MNLIKCIIIILFLAPVVWADSTLVDDDSTYFEDTYILDADSINYVTSITLHVSTFSGFRHSIFDIQNNVWDAIGVDRYVDSMVCSLYCTFTLGNPIMRVFGLWKNQTETDDCNYYWWDSSGQNDWTTPGAESADDGGSYNSGDGTGADRRATAFTTVQTLLTATWYTYTVIDTAWFNDNYTNDRNLIWMMEIDHSETLKWAQFASLNGSTASERFRVWIYHSAAPVAEGLLNIIFTDGN